MFSALLNSTKNNDALRPLLGSGSGSGSRPSNGRSHGDSSPDHDELSTQDQSLGRGQPGYESDSNADLSDEDGDGDHDYPSLLPIFSSAHLDALPVFTLTHAIRTSIQKRCETTLSWDQLRSPQVSQFLVKPIQMHIRSSHFSRATLYALIANCLQFNKESQALPGNAGVLRTRSALAELLAIRLLKDFNIRELIDALSYDFDPLQGMDYSSHSAARQAQRNSIQHPRNITYRTGSARTSTLEVAIRAEAKRFLSHPLIVQHLEAIWAGSIVFHSAADNLHRMPRKPLPTQLQHYGALHNSSDEYHASEIKHPKLKAGQMIRRSVTLYNPNDASLFKLSRLRVPRYRQIFSMLSYAGMLGLFLAVLIQRNSEITPFEVVFWFWSSGFMMDEILGFTEQGFSLYILSVWNAFDIGILLLFSVYYILRLYSIVVSDDQKEFVSSMAYDTLASTAVLLFPRLFSLLDHYRYFSQLLIAFRLMAQDLAAVLILIAITCSGFFVAFTLAFGKGAYDGSSVAYALFQILMGYTVAAWDAWENYNFLGKVILTLFVIICHFLVVTLLITVLTNSFMAIVRNANEEHQFLFAINVLSMVKSDALFSYVAPSNIIGWLISPLRFLMPLRQFVKLNRSVIKLTHFPILWLVFLYERFWLSWYALESDNLIERSGRERIRPLQAFAGNSGNGQDKFNPSVRVREPSATTRYKDRALEEVFRQPYEGELSKPKTPETTPRPSSAVDQWMNGMADIASPLMERTTSRPDQAEGKRPKLYRSATSLAVSTTKRRLASRSMVSEADHRGADIHRGLRETYDRDLNPRETDETFSLKSSDEDDNDNDDDQDSPFIANTRSLQKRGLSKRRTVSDILGSPEIVPIPRIGADPVVERDNNAEASTKSPSMGNFLAPPRHASHPSNPRARHTRQASTNTIVFNPISESPRVHRSSRPGSPSRSKQANPPADVSIAARDLGARSNRRPSKYPDHNTNQNIRSSNNLLAQNDFKRLSAINQFQILPRTRRETSYDTLALDLASDIGDNRHIGLAPGLQHPNEFAPGSYNTAWNIENSMRRQWRSERDQNAEDSNMMGRMVLARMNILEEGFKDILREMKEWRRAKGSRSGSDFGNISEPQHRPQMSVARRSENAKPD